MTTRKKSTQKKPAKSYDGALGPRRTPPYGIRTGEPYIYELPDGRFHLAIGAMKEDGRSTTVRRTFKTLDQARKARDKVARWKRAGTTAGEITERLPRPRR